MEDQKKVKNQVIDELVETKERERILNLTVDLICIAGTDGYFKYVNPAWEKTLGFGGILLFRFPQPPRASSCSGWFQPGFVGGLQQSMGYTGQGLFKTNSKGKPAHGQRE